ncbi:MAG: hypothetical protein ACN6NI_03625 [Acinetobacter sp.]
MPRNNYLPALEQVYEFLKERPGFKQKSEFDKTVEYFSVLHEGDSQDFSIQAFHNISGQFGTKEILSISAAPKFTDKSDFLNWVNIQINH